MVKVKICGITEVYDALSAVTYGADAIGFILYCKSKRYVDPKTVRFISKKLPPFITKVGVFVNEDRNAVLEILSYCGLDFAQLHGDESPDDCRYIGRERVIKAFRIKEEDDVKAIENYVDCVSAVLLDTYSESEYGGTGRTFNWDIAKKVIDRFEVPVILSGGLTPENIKEAVKSVLPFAVDVSSGVEEKPGKKDLSKVKDFIRFAKCL
jgi:phosphoribosylanthranilate isomerase